MDIKLYPQGYWEVKGRIFHKKYEALLYATETDSPVWFKFFNDIWENFDQSLLGTISLQELYKTRAQRLREKYDYLILYFSGGSDSYNVLRTFIDNNIKLDEICVKWPTYPIDNKSYIPNTQDKSAYNYLSEWDFTIKPVLEEISKTNPEIKIEIVDWFQDPNSIGSWEIFQSVNHWHDIEVPLLAVWSPSERILIDQGKSVGSIYGVDKPLVFYENNIPYICFVDSATAMANPNPCNIFGTEMFYWTPEFPLLTFEMGFQSAIAIEKDHRFKKLKSSVNLRCPQWRTDYQNQQSEHRTILYNNWNNRFQTDKPILLDRSDKQSWMIRDPKLKKFVQLYNEQINYHAGKIREDLLERENEKVMYRAISTRKFFICNKNRLME